MRVGWAKADCAPGSMLGSDESTWAFDGYNVSVDILFPSRNLTTLFEVVYIHEKPVETTFPIVKSDNSQIVSDSRVEVQKISKWWINNVETGKRHSYFSIKSRNLLIFSVFSVVRNTLISVCRCKIV